MRPLLTSRQIGIKPFDAMRLPATEPLTSSIGAVGDTLSGPQPIFSAAEATRLALGGSSLQELKSTGE